MQQQNKKNTKLINFHCDTEENIKTTIQIGYKIPDHPYGILMTGGSGSRKANALLNLVNHILYINKRAESK